MLVERTVSIWILEMTHSGIGGMISSSLRSGIDAQTVLLWVGINRAPKHITWAPRRSVH